MHVMFTHRDAEHIPGCNCSFRKDQLKAVGGFDPRFRTAGDDVDVCWRLLERGLEDWFPSRRHGLASSAAFAADLLETAKRLRQGGSVAGGEVAIEVQLLWSSHVVRTFIRERTYQGSRPVARVSRLLGQRSISETVHCETQQAGFADVDPRVVSLESDADRFGCAVGAHGASGIVGDPAFDFGFRSSTVCRANRFRRRNSFTPSGGTVCSPGRCISSSH